MFQGVEKDLNTIVSRLQRIKLIFKVYNYSFECAKQEICFEKNWEINYYRKQNQISTNREKKMQEYKDYIKVRPDDGQFEINLQLHFSV